MYRLFTILTVLAAVSAAPAPKPVVVYPPAVYHPPVYHPPVYPAPLHYPAPVAVSHVSTLLNHHPVLPYSPYRVLPVPAAPIVPPLF
ncbi:uncharacterized protein LOC133516104 [Cydia pomonella]|uniref:uncharacterized protein LOC133516104 n=1 Tax=Cydia pomonella TaxID=82600 RepID=UPI002ADE8192|nr:uncharacterized protein LOC133516104 [Cydia pomonella]